MLSRESAPGSAVTLVINPMRVRLITLAIVTLMTLANLVVQTIAYFSDTPGIYVDSRIANFFDLGREVNLPTWYQVVALATSALLLIWIGISTLRSSNLTRGLPWLLLGGAFLYLSADEMLSLHEETVDMMQSVFGIEHGILYFAWVIPAGLAVLLLFISLIPFLRKLHPDTRRRFLFAGVIYIAGAVGMELVGGDYYSRNYEVDFTYKLITSVEEDLEMIGVVMFLYAILVYIGIHFHGICVSGMKPEE
jgi:hypothetical protein